MPDFLNDKLNGPSFEASVRQIARRLYFYATTTGSIIIDGRERDDIIDTGSELIVVEATKSRKLDKTEYDLNKSIELVKSLRRIPKYVDYNFRILIVTSEDPTADQSRYVKEAKSNCPKEIISFNTLFSRLFDARHYIRVRGDYSFGSVRNLKDENDFKVPQAEYIPTALRRENSIESIKANDLAMRLPNGGRYVLYGDYGSGKSMTLRDIYFTVRDQFSTWNCIHCPIYINLRDHIAQVQPDEALYRHAEKVGFPTPYSLISAWRSGFVSLFLDGFDELTPPQFATSVNNLRQARRFAVEIIKRFIEQTPTSAPIIIAGRESYFDDRSEAKNALGYDNNAQVFDLAGFTDSDIERFLKTKSTDIPDWLPSRPLLLGYLANTGLLDHQDLSIHPAVGWDQVLERVCQREVSQVWGVGFEAHDLRHFIEGLATCARKKRDGRGLEGSDLKSVFRETFGRDSDEPANLLTGRLPGLGAVSGRPGAREFVDSDFAEAAASGDLKRYIDNPFEARPPLSDICNPMGWLGREMSVKNTLDISAKVSIALERATHHENLTTTAKDLMSILIDNRKDYTGCNIHIKDADFDTFIIDPDIDFSAITLSRCAIETIEITQAQSTIVSGNLPNIQDCVISTIAGVVSEKDIPNGVLTGSTTVEFYSANTPTNDAVLRLTLPDPMKVMLTVLRKLFLQRGSGRQHSALRRGLPNNLLKYVDPIIAIIVSEGFAQIINLNERKVIIPNRAYNSDAFDIINGPNMSNHPLVRRIRKM